MMYVDVTVDLFPFVLEPLVRQQELPSDLGNAWTVRGIVKLLRVVNSAVRRHLAKISFIYVILY